MKTGYVPLNPLTPAELRRSLGFRRRQVASRVGISLRTLERIEHGHTWGRPETLQRIAELLGVEPEVYVIAVLQSWRQKQSRKKAA